MHRQVLLHVNFWDLLAGFTLSPHRLWCTTFHLGEKAVSRVPGGVAVLAFCHVGRDVAQDKIVMATRTGRRLVAVVGREQYDW